MTRPVFYIDREWYLFTNGNKSQHCRLFGIIIISHGYLVVLCYRVLVPKMGILHLLIVKPYHDIRLILP